MFEHQPKSLSSACASLKAQPAKPRRIFIKAIETFSSIRHHPLYVHTLDNIRIMKFNIPGIKLFSHTQHNEEQEVVLTATHSGFRPFCNVLPMIPGGFNLLIFFVHPDIIYWGRKVLLALPCQTLLHSFSHPP